MYILLNIFMLLRILNYVDTFISVVTEVNIMESYIVFKAILFCVYFIIFSMKMLAKWFLLSIALISKQSLIQSVPNLPGLDHLKSGFDASAMVTPMDLEVNVGDKSKYAIFNLSESGPIHTLNVNGHSQVFETSALTQVTDLSIRKENYCEVITSSFEEFYK